MAIPMRGVAGDQQAAYGQACFAPGMLKATYGTGCFLLANTGEAKVASTARMLATVFYQLEGRRTFALEGSIFMAGATVQDRLRDSLGLIADAAESEALAHRADPKSRVSASRPSGSARRIGTQSARRDPRPDTSRCCRHRGGGPQSRRLPDP